MPKPFHACDPAQFLLELESILRKSSVVRKLTATSLTLIAAASFMVVSSAPASAASCYGFTCDGADPNAAGCGDAYTVNAGSFTTPAARRYVELRYSPACGAAWARYSYGVAATKMTIYSYSKTTGTLLNLESAQPAGESGWTRMVPAADKNVRICAEENWWTPPTHWTYCASMVGFGSNGTPQPQFAKDPV